MMKKVFLRSAIFFIITILIGFAFVPVIKNLSFGLDLKGGFEILYKIEPLSGTELTTQALRSTVKSIQKRVDTLGVSEPEITVEGENIRIKLAGVTDEETAKSRLSTPAVLSFRDMNDELLMDASVLTSGGANITTNEKGQYVVGLNIADNEKFYRVTKAVSERDDNYIVIWLDFDPEKDTILTERNNCGALGNSRCLSVASVSQAFSGNVIITGDFTREEVENLVDLINSGSLPTKLTTLSSKTVDASFGNDMLIKAGIAGLISIGLIILMLTIIYRVSGLFSGLCLIIYTFLVFLLFNLIDGVLTLPGIAAMILGVGMAVDSNIISFERIKDELRRGKKLPDAINSGDKSSLITILDANITTFIAAIILFMFGESSVKGFATILIITIIVTMFTMVFINRTILHKLSETGFFDTRKKAFIGYKEVDAEKNKNKKESIYNGVNYLKYKPIYITIPLIIIIAAGIFFGVKGVNLGIDFTGGSSITLASETSINESEIDKILSDYEVLDKTIKGNEGYIKISETLEDNDVNLLKSDFRTLGYDSDISVISTMVKRDLTKNALVSLLYAAVAMLIYVAIRFAFNYSVSSISALIHDILIMASVFILFRLQVNYIFIAALLTIIGYSINDTIVIFDRIRENYNREFKGDLKDKNDVYDLVNMSINGTKFRTIVTTVTTLIPVIVLLCFGISAIYEFNIALLVGLFAGVISSMFIAPTIWAHLTIRDLRHPEKKKKEEFHDELDEMTIKGINA